MPEHKNIFTKGVNVDLAPSAIGQQFATGGVNIRLEERGGKTFVVANIDGNQVQFQVTPGFVPFGSVSYGGITFIFSHNPVTGEGEVGSYPSPKPPGIGGFDRVYSPLQNWNAALNPATGISRQPFRTKLFNFDCPFQVEAEARLDYDGSVNIYFADWKNPLRRVNSGFHVATGSFTNRMLWTGNWNAMVNVMGSPSIMPEWTDVRVTDGGALKAGNYFVYPVLVTENLDETPTCLGPGPIQVARDLLQSGVLIDGAASSTDTQKAIEIDFTNIDPGYKYLRVIVSRYFDDSFEIFQLAQFFPITPGSTTLTVRINGDEERVDKTIADIVEKRSDVIVPRTITQLQNILWGGNWKSDFMPYDDMKTLAVNITAKPADAAQMDEIPDWSIIVGGDPTGAFQYKDYRRTLSKVGYFRGEAYAFGIVFVNSNGTHSQPIPVTGYDAWFDPSGTSSSNNRGILRMPSNMNPGYSFQAPSVQSGENMRRLRVLGVKFDHGGMAAPAWLSRMVGFYFVRAERKPDLIYQGFSTNSYNMRLSGNSTPVPPVFIPFPASNVSATENHIPEIGNGSPLLFRFRYHQHGGLVSNSTEIILRYGTVIDKKFGLFSTDHFFKKSLNAGRYYMVRQGRFSLSASDLGGGIRTPSFMYEGLVFTPDAVGAAVGQAECYNINERSSAFVSGFTSYFNASEPSQSPPFLWTAYEIGFLGANYYAGNLRICQRNYIGLDITKPGTVDVGLAETASGVAVVNLYGNDPTPDYLGGTYDLSLKYDPSVTLYAPISDLIPISDWPSLPNMVFYRGDCFLQKTYHRHLNEGGYHFPSDYSDNDKGYAYGSIAGFVQECSINTAMRFESGNTNQDNRYYPEWEPNSPGYFAYFNSAYDESRWLNNGYNNTLGAQFALGIDPAIPFHGKSYPTRVRYSNFYAPGDFKDGYSIWDLAAHRDYNHAYGQITSLKALDGKLIMVQDSCISYLPTNVQVSVPQDDGVSEARLIIGNGDILSEWQKELSQGIGSQHQWSVILGLRSLYGFDRAMGVFWSVDGNGFKRLSDEQGFASDAATFCQYLTMQSTVMDKYPDSPICEGGVVGYFDAGNNEVGWTVLLYKDANGHILSPPIKRTIAFNEKLQVYLQDRTFHSPFYIGINKDFFSLSPGASIAEGQTTAPDFWRFGPGPGKAVFYGVQNPFSLKWTAAPSPFTTSVYDHLYLSVNDVQPTEIRAETEFQSYTQSPVFSNDHWSTAEYKENQIAVPVLKATAVGGQGLQEYGVRSKMRGLYLSLKFTWMTPIEVLISASTVFFRQSQK